MFRERGINAPERKLNNERFSKGKELSRDAIRDSLMPKRNEVRKCKNARKTFAYIYVNMYTQTVTSTSRKSIISKAIKNIWKYKQSVIILVGSLAFV